MYRIRCLNNISERGLSVFRDQGYEFGDSILDGEAIVLRSHKLNVEEINSQVLAIGRAGAGVKTYLLRFARRRSLFLTRQCKCGQRTCPCRLIVVSSRCLEE